MKCPFLEANDVVAVLSLRLPLSLHITCHQISVQCLVKFYSVKRAVHQVVVINLLLRVLLLREQQPRPLELHSTRAGLGRCLALALCSRLFRQRGV